MNPAVNHSTRAMTKLGVVSFLNSRPLIEGLSAQRGLRLEFAVPAELAAMLGDGRVDAALIPVVDLARRAGLAHDNCDAGLSGREWKRVSDACIGSDGDTLTVRVFSRVPPRRMRTLHVDGDSHTSVALAHVLWSQYYERPVTLMPLAQAPDPDDCESILLIGDKVVTQRPNGFDYEIDLGGAWKQWTHLPFVFAVWAAPVSQVSQLPGGQSTDGLARLLNEARDRGVARAAEIANAMGPARGWPVELAREYLTQRLIYTITPAARAGMHRFLELAADEGLIAAHEELLR